MTPEAEKLVGRLPGVQSPIMRGDNLAIVLASYFEPSIESEEMDESETWKQGAVDAANEVLAAIHEHYQPLIERQFAQIAALRKELDEALVLLKPFAGSVDEYAGLSDDTWVCSNRLAANRAARRYLEQKDAK